MIHHNTFTKRTPLTHSNHNLKSNNSKASLLKRPLALLSVAVLVSACAAFSGRETAGEYVDDASITTSVKSNILQDSSLKMFQIHVETFKNQVQLSGFVDSAAEISRAGQIAKSVDGVQGVKNNLVLRKKGHTVK
ncbi:MAG: BON domain-containing protein [Alphaproteobacteria bacterium]|jgi:hyperosmotically inducible protein|nr:BON domain-containing protein [Alphaproteobacteria bacterium]